MTQIVSRFSRLKHLGRSINRRSSRRLVLLLIVSVLLLVSVSLVFAQGGGNFGLTWWTVDGGGHTSSGGDYAISGAIGQPDAGEMSGGAFGLSGGFWNASILISGVEAPASGTRRIYLPLILR